MLDVRILFPDFNLVYPKKSAILEFIFISSFFRSFLFLLQSGVMIKRMSQALFKFADALLQKTVFSFTVWLLGRTLVFVQNFTYIWLLESVHMTSYILSKRFHCHFYPVFVIVFESVVNALCHFCAHFFLMITKVRTVVVIVSILIVSVFLYISILIKGL